MSEATAPSFAYLGPAGTYHDEALLPRKTRLRAR